MQSRLSKLKGFTLVELLTVLVIIAILAAVAAPIYQANTQRSKASEGVSGMSSVRQALRDYKASGGGYFNINASGGTGLISDVLPAIGIGTTGVPNPTKSGVAVDVGTAQYFSNASYSVDTTKANTTGNSGLFTAPNAQDFLIEVDGSQSVLCTGTTPPTGGCAVKGGTSGDASSFRLEMDNSGRTYISYSSGAAGTWSSY